MGQTYTRLIVHVVFSTKMRRPLLAPEFRPRVLEYLGGAVRAEQGVATLINGVADHVHLLVNLPQRRALSDLMRGVKGASSRFIHQTFPTLSDFAWQDGYSAFTVSPGKESEVRAYIANQEQHHARHSFADELRALLCAHDIKFDERYLLG